MNLEEAKFILSSLRPDSADHHDPRFTEALELAEQTPELKAWLESMQRQDLVISEKLASLDTPSDLKSTILAGLHVSQPKPAWKKRSFLMMAAAAVGVLAASVTFLSLPGPVPAPDPTIAFREAMITGIKNLDEFDYVSEDPEAVRTWLNAHSSSSTVALPEKLKTFKTAGCKLLNWQGNRASLICFHLNPEDPRPTVHLVVVDTELFPEHEMTQPEIEMHQRWASAMWREGGKTYLLATVHPPSRLDAWAGKRSS